MVGWHHRLNGHEFEQAPGDGEGQGHLACCSSWGCRAGHNLATEQQCILGCTFKVNLILIHVPQKKEQTRIYEVSALQSWQGIHSPKDAVIISVQSSSVAQSCPTL